jgi:hypothetical protein
MAAGPVPSSTRTTLLRLIQPTFVDDTIMRSKPSALVRNWPTARTRTSY